LTAEGRKPRLATIGELTSGDDAGVFRHPVKVYYGQPGGAVIVQTDSRLAPLGPRYDLANHSPTGFSWGYGGSGPAQLALALLADALGDDALALRLYQRFKFRVIGALPLNEAWAMTEVEVLKQARAVARDRDA
jgi:Family of unknown function (DUF6166)